MVDTPDAPVPVIGRPTKFSRKIAEDICAQLIEGKSLREICTQQAMPAKTTVCRWLSTKPDFQDQYARAREMQAELMADETLDIADDGSNDWMERTYGDTVVEVVNQEAVQRSKLRVDTRKWIASKMLPKRFGERVDMAHSGQVKVEHSVARMSDEQINLEIERIIGAAKPVATIDALGPGDEGEAE